MDTKEIDKILTRLFPIHRSLTGPGQEETLQIIQEYIPNMKIYGIKSGEKVYDWVIPQVWTVKEAYIRRQKDGCKICDFNKNNLELMHYSIPFYGKDLEWKDIKEHIHTLPEQPNAIPYVTSYYNKEWGFAMKYNDYDAIEKYSNSNHKYEVCVDTKLEDGEMKYGEIIIPGKTNKTILLSTYICHPSLANDNLSGIVLTIQLVKWLLKRHDCLRHTYRIVFLPETIGSIAYISKVLKPNNVDIVGGYVVTCVGKAGPYTYIRTKKNSLTNEITEYTLATYYNKCYPTRVLPFTDCGSDERQYNFPNVNYPIGSITRTKHSSYPEYHTSLDDQSNISVDVIYSTLDLYKTCLNIFEYANLRYKCPIVCEPHMGKYDLYPKTGVAGKDADIKRKQTRIMMNVLRYSDGELNLLDISKKLNTSIFIVYNIVLSLCEKNILIPVTIEDSLQSTE